jgi:thiamine biosynthesis lipoprotein
VVSSNVKQSHLKRWLFYCCLIGLASCLSACSGEPEAVQLAGRTMGTTWHVTYTPTAERESTTEVQRGIEAVLAEVNLSMSTYLDTSEISGFNRAEPKEWFSVSTDFMTVLQAALAIGDASGGVYDVTVGPVVNLWGFGPEATTDTIPEKEAVIQLLRQIGQDKLRVDEQNQNILKTGDLELDFSSIAKGFGVDRVADWLLSRGVTDFLVEVGGEMRLAGLNSKKSAWRIAIEQPYSMVGSVATAIEVTNQAIATSGDYRNYFEVEGRRYSHTIDPRTGFPVDHDLVSVTVIHSSAMTADGWATAFMVMGAVDAMKVARELDLAVYFIQRSGQSFKSSYSPLFESYLEGTN